MMKKFVLRSLFYALLPVAGGILNFIYLETDQGDLVRLGKLYKNELPKEKLQKVQNRQYHMLSELNLSEENDFDILTIGDSFSAESHGFQNNLIENGCKVLNFANKLSSNPLQELIILMNSDFFNQVSIDYVILESIERDFNARFINLDLNAKVNLDSLYRSSWAKRKTKNVNLKSFEFFSTTTITAPWINLAYLFVKKPMLSKTYKLNLKYNSLFNSGINNILVYQEDINKMDSKNSLILVKNSVDILNQLSIELKKKGVILIVLIPPDKYDLYYDFLVEEDQILEPLFYENYSSLVKEYIDIPVYTELNKSIMFGEKNIYYYDDTHWSPVGRKITSDLLLNYLK